MIISMINVSDGQRCVYTATLSLALDLVHSDKDSTLSMQPSLEESFDPF